MAGQTYTVPVADPELARRKTDVEDSADESSMTDEEQKERDDVAYIMACRVRYGADRKSKENEWTESFKMYMSWVDKALNPFLSNLFIPKTHEAVELLAAFLIGTNQNITASPEGAGDSIKSRVAGQWLDFLWRKVLKARVKILVWIKQGIIFGNGILKLGWDADMKRAWMNVCAIEDVYFDYFEADIQDSELIIHEIRRDLDDVQNDAKYDVVDKEGKTIRSQVITGDQGFVDPSKALFSTYDGSMSKSECRGRVLVMEVWTKGTNGQDLRLKTLLPTSLGWRIARDAENTNRYRDKKDGKGTQFRPFVKLRFKTSALPNRGYDMGAVFPSIHIQKAFNDFMRQYADAVSFINNPMWKKRRGARINPMELVRRPGGVITMGDPNKDLVQDTIGDVKQSIIEILNRLDKEFQEASMVVNLVKGISQSQTATGDAIAQQNVQTLLDMINDNIVDALSEAGQMVLAISLANTEGEQEILLYENDQETAMLKFDPKNIDGIHDIRIVPDRKENVNRAGQNAALVKVYPLVANDGQLIGKYPTLKEKMIKRIMENDGVGDPDYFFQEDQAVMAQLAAAAQGQSPESKVSVSMSYKDVPDDVRREIEQAAGLKPSSGGAPAPVQTNEPAPQPSPTNVPVPQKKAPAGVVA